MPRKATDGSRAKSIRSIGVACAANLSKPPKRLRQQGFLLKQFLNVLGRQTLQQSGALRRHGNEHASAIDRRMSSFDEPRADEPIDHLNRAMGLEQHLIGKVPDHDRPSGVGLDDQQGLILQRRHAFGAGCGLAERQKPPQGEPKRRERFVNAWIKLHGFTHT